jgi:hypothetical protein
MELMGQIHVLATLSPRDRALDTHQLGDDIDFEVGVDPLENRNAPGLCRASSSESFLDQTVSCSLYRLNPPGS